MQGAYYGGPGSQEQERNGKIAPVHMGYAGGERLVAKKEPEKSEKENRPGRVYGAHPVKAEVGVRPPLEVPSPQKGYIPTGLEEISH